MKRDSPKTFDNAPPDSLTKWPGFLLAWVADMAVQGYTQTLAPLRIKPHHLGILTLLHSDGPMVQARIGDRLSIVKPAIVGLINELEALDLVARRPHPTDQRAFEIHLLEAGKQRILEAEKLSRAVTAEFFSTLSPKEQKSFQTMLMRLAQANAPKIKTGKETS